MQSLRAIRRCSSGFTCAFSAEVRDAGLRRRHYAGRIMGVQSTGRLAPSTRCQARSVSGFGDWEPLSTLKEFEGFVVRARRDRKPGDYRLVPRPDDDIQTVEQYLGFTAYALQLRSHRAREKAATQHSEEQLAEALRAQAQRAEEQGHADGAVSQNASHNEGASGKNSAAVASDNEGVTLATDVQGATDATDSDGAADDRRHDLG